CVKGGKLIRLRYGELCGELLCVELDRERQGLGLSLAGNKDRSCLSIFVVGISPGGPAAKDGRIRVGDELLEINNQVLYGRSHLNASAIIKSASSKVKITLISQAEALQNSEIEIKINPLPLMIFIWSQSEDIHLLNKCSFCSMKSLYIQKPFFVYNLVFFNPSTCPIVPGQEIIIEIAKGRSGLGLSIVGGEDTQLVRLLALLRGDHVDHDRLRKFVSVSARDESHSYTAYKTKIFYLYGRNGTGVFISDVVKGGVAELDGRLMQGDQIISVNGDDMRSALQETVAAILKCARGVVLLELGRLKAASWLSSRRPSQGSQVCFIINNDDSIDDISQGPTDALGISIAGGKDSPLGDIPIFLAMIQANGVAAKTHRLKVGDRIVSINSQSLEGLSHGDVVTMLKNAYGSIILQVHTDHSLGHSETYPEATLALSGLCS
uniref:PDZ domain-containing protein n=1 Tax=Oncorhynchus kisutch TaxID=8019 RepID=A0A8C7CXN9_ONCKI